MNTQQTTSGARPAADATEGVQRSGVQSHAASDSKNELIAPHRGVLVVEDNDALRTEIAELFRDDGFRVVEASDGAAALGILRGGAPIDVVLLDLWMPTMDGWRFRLEQRRDPALRDVPVVVLTADDSVQAQAIDADAVVPKPFEADELCEAVRSVLAKHQSSPAELPSFVRDAMSLIAGAVGHEIANPLTVLIHALEHSRRTGRPIGNERGEPNLQELLDQCWRMVETIRSLRDLPMPRFTASREVDVARAVETALGATIGSLQGVVLQQGPARVAADAQVVHYICRALLRNAVEAVSGPQDQPEAAGVKVRVGKEGSEVVLDVHDSGPQIPADDLNKVFSPDFLGRGRGWSAGLRLWFVREAVQAMGGSVEIYNDPQSGVHCRVRLPAAA